MSEFKWTTEATKWFDSAFASGDGPLREKFDRYYLCLILGLLHGRRSQLEGSPDTVIDYWIGNYKGTREQVLALLLCAAIEKHGLEWDDRADIQGLCGVLFSQSEQTGLTSEGMDLANQFAFGGYRLMTERYPHDSAPQSQVELIQFVSKLIADAPPLAT